MADNKRGTWNAGKTQRLVFLALWSAIIVAMALIPNVGYITLNPTIGLTTLQIPVIIGAILLGPGDGAFLGLVFGITSMLQAPVLQPVTAFLFNPFVPMGNYKSALIAIVPRVMIGVVAALVFRLFDRFDKTHVVSCAAAGISGALTTSVLVLGGIYVFFKDEFAKTIGKAASAVLGVLYATFITNSILEIIVTAIAVALIAKALFVVQSRSRHLHRG